MIYCNDTDLLHWEPNLFRQTSFASQTLLSGSANLSGSTLSISGGSLVDARVIPGHVVVLDGGTAGCFPIVSVDDPTTLKISVLYDAMWPLTDPSSAVPVGTATGLTFTIRTFSPQARLVSQLLNQAAGIDPPPLGAVVPVLLNPEALRRPCTLGTLEMIYSALVATAEDPSPLAIREQLYERLFRRALRSVQVELDTDGDGEGNLRRALNVLEMSRD